jgi:hypothetical protein
MSFWALRSGESHKGSRLASRQPRGVSEGILESSVPRSSPHGEREREREREALAGWYNPLDRLPYIGDVCLVAKVGLEAQCISGGPEFTDWESKINAGSSPGPGFRHQNVRKTPPTTHKGGSREVSHV